MARKIVITSGKGGVGKTTVCANLGIALASQGYRVAVIDLDFGLNNLDVVLGIEGSVLYDMFDLLEGRCRVSQALISTEKRKNLYVLPSGSFVGNADISGQNIKLILESINHSFDFILVDSPAGIDLGFHRAVSACDEALVITTPSLTSLRDADKVLTILYSYKPKSIGLVVNRARGDLIMNDKMMMPLDIQEMLKTELIGIIPEEDAVFLSSGYELPKKSESFKAFKLLSQNLINGSKKLYDVTNKYSGFFGSIRRSIKRSV